MKTVLNIARWEYLTRIRSKWFIIGTIITPLLIIAMTFVPTLLMGVSEDKQRSIAIIDETNYLGQLISEELNQRYQLKDGSPRYQVFLYPGPYQAQIEDNLKEMVEEKTIIAYLILRKDILESNRIEYYSRNLSRWQNQSQLEKAINEVIQREKVRKYQLQPEIVEEITTTINMQMFQISKEGKIKKGSELTAFFTSLVFLFLLFFSIFGTANILMRSVLEERTNRVVEILLSSTTANQLMYGKILGLGLLGLSQVFFYLLIGSRIAAQRGISMFTTSHILLFLIYFVLGYMFYAAFFATIGSIFNSEQEAQQAVSIISIISVIPIVLSSWVLQNPDQWIIKAITYIPFLTPYFMILRLSLDSVTAFDIVSTLVLLFVSVILVMYLAGKIFRVAILIYGKRPTLPEILRWVKG